MIYMAVATTGTTKGSVVSSVKKNRDTDLHADLQIDATSVMKWVTCVTNVRRREARQIPSCFQSRTVKI